MIGRVKARKSSLFFVFLCFVAAFLALAVLETKGDHGWDHDYDIRLHPKKVDSDNHPKLKTGRYEIREGTLLSQTWKVASINFDVDEELYFPEVVPCFTCADKSNLKKNDDGELCICDFSRSGDDCGRAPKGCPKDTCSKTDIEKYCSNNLNKWRTIDVDSGSNDEGGVTRFNGLELKENEELYFRFHAKNPCLGYRIKAYYESGLVDFLVSQAHPEPDEFTQTWSTSSRQYPDLSEIDFCPEFMRWKGLGTFFVTVVGRAREAKFDLVFYAQEATQDPEPEDKDDRETLPCEDRGDEDHLCVREGVPYSYFTESSQTPLYLRYDLKGKKGTCKNFFVYLQADQGDGGIAGDFDIRYPNYSSILNPKYHSEYPASDQLLVQHCFEDDESVPFYLGMNRWTTANYTIRVTSNKRPFLVQGSKLTPYQYAFSAKRVMTGSCPGVTPAISWMCQDWKSYCGQFFMVYPADDPNVFWPTPGMWRSINSPVSAALFSSLNEYDIPVRKRRTESISLVMVMSNTIFGKENIYLSDRELGQCTFTSSQTAFTKDGKALLGRAKAVNRGRNCDADELEEIVDLGKKYIKDLRKAVEFNDILQLAYQVETLTFSAPWMACQNYASELINSTTEHLRLPSTACLITDQSSSEFQNDPCCNVGLLADQCCAPRNESVATLVYGEVDEDRIDSKCADSDCLHSYIKDLKSINENEQTCSRFSSDQYPALIQEATAFYANCKTKYRVDDMQLGLIPCTSDLECKFGGVETKCNLVTQRCVGSWEVERATIRCILDGMSLYTEYYFKEAYKLPGRKNDKKFFDAFINAVSRDECRNENGHSESLRSRQEFKVIDQVCAQSKGCIVDVCLDTSCEISPTPCLATCQANWIDRRFKKNECNQKEKCNWMSQDCDALFAGGDIDPQDVSKQCRKACEEDDDSFCAYCFSDSHCVKIPGISSEKECEDTEACYLLDGTIELLSRAECRRRQNEGCTESCPGMSCESKSGVNSLCIAETQNSRESCQGVWMDSWGGQCWYPNLGPELCTSLGFTFQSCGGLTVDQCDACVVGDPSCPVTQSLLNCWVVPRQPCASKSECLSVGGYCDDADWYDNFALSTDQFGGCVFSKGAAAWSGVVPICYFGLMSPQGCYIPYFYLNETDCQNFGGQFHFLASNERECRRNRGCDTYYQIRALSTIESGQCKSCGKETKPFFRWTDGKWASATPIKLRWTRPEVEDLYEWSPAVDFLKVYETLQESVQGTIFADLRSSALCKFSARSEILEVVACDCEEGDGGSKCFEQDLGTTEIGAGRPCIGLGSKIRSVDASISISEDAVSVDSKDRCVSVTISTQVILTLKQSETKPFSPLTKVREFDSFNVVRNEDDAIVGRVMSNGLLVELTGDLESYEVCLRVSEEAGEPKASFNRWDLGTPKKDNDEFLEAMGLSAKSHSDDEYCFEVKKPDQEQTYFLIARQENYESKDGSLYGGESAAWWTFAAIYTTLAVFTFITVVLHFFGFRLHYYFLGLFIFFTAMCIIRAIYFFLLAAQVFDEGSSLAVAYFLIEFPTLLYFTAFSCLGAFWVFLLYAHMQRKASRKIVMLWLLFNTLLYIMFVVLLILFQTLGGEDSSVCPTRVPPEEDNTAQRIISIVYQSFMAGVSVLLALIVTWFGFRLLSTLKSKSFEGKIAVVTLVCAVGLILHCAIILYLSATLTYDFVLIVIMIVLSEMVPIAVITIQFSIIRGLTTGGSTLPSYNRKANFLKSLRFFGKGSGSSSEGVSMSPTDTRSRGTSQASLAAIHATPSSTRVGTSTGNSINSTSS